MLALAHKYCAPRIEARARAAAIKIVNLIEFGPKTYVHIPAILDTARLVDCPELGKLAKEAFLRLIQDSSHHAHLALCFGKHLEDKDIQAVSYLSLLHRYREDWGWEDDISLTVRDKERLLMGVRRSAQRWQKTHARILEHPLGCGRPKCSRKGVVVQKAVERQATVPFFDIFGMLDAYSLAIGDASVTARSCLYCSQCQSSALGYVEAERAAASQNLAALFFDDAPLVSNYGNPKGLKTDLKDQLVPRFWKHR